MEKDKKEKNEEEEKEEEKEDEEKDEEEKEKMEKDKEKKNEEEEKRKEEEEEEKKKKKKTKNLPFPKQNPQVGRTLYQCTSCVYLQYQFSSQTEPDESELTLSQELLQTCTALPPLVSLVVTISIPQGLLFSLP
jgi:uncharacterized membrane protein YdbT with pleckstrin-like domain